MMISRAIVICPNWFFAFLLLVAQIAEITCGVSVPDRPNIVVIPNPSLDGEDLIMSCKPSTPTGPGNTTEQIPVMYSWRNFSSQMKEVNETLKIKAVASSPGEFQCQRKKTEPMSLPFSPRVCHLLIQMTSDAVEDGQPMTLICLTSAQLGKRPHDWLSWVKDNHEINGSAAETFTTLANVTNPGYFECQAKSGEIFTSAPCFCHKKPTIKQRGGNLTCHTASNVTSRQYLWYRNKQLVAKQHGPTIQFSKSDVRPHHLLQPHHHPSDHHPITRYRCRIKESKGRFYSEYSDDFSPIEVHSASQKPNSASVKSRPQAGHRHPATSKSPRYKSRKVHPDARAREGFKARWFHSRVWHEFDPKLFIRPRKFHNGKYSPDRRNRGHSRRNISPG